MNGNQLQLGDVVDRKVMKINNWVKTEQDRSKWKRVVEKALELWSLLKKKKNTINSKEIYTISDK